MTNETALREALALAANRLARCALDQEMFTEKYHQVAEWGEEARAAAQSPSQPVVADSPVQFATVRDGGDEWHIECRFKDGQKFAAVTVDKDHESLADWIANALSAHPQASPPLVQSEGQDTVAFVQEWMMSGDHEPDQWTKDFAAAIDARLAHSQTDTQEGEAIAALVREKEQPL